MQITHSSPDMKSTIGQSTAFSEYVKFVADERSLPTFWTEEERQWLWATTLERHVAAKLRSLEKEYHAFYEASKDVSWSEQWWGESGCLSLEDWKIVDAMYRSRAMDFDSYGLCLVPIMDMANHTTEQGANAMYAIEGDNKEARLYLDGKSSVERREEIKIIYGLDKGASEMLFSYGFIDSQLTDAGAMLLGWEPPADDELRDVKMEALNLEPGFKILVPHQAAGIVKWIGPCVWAMSVNQEDGLRIRLIEDDNPEVGFQVWFHDKQIPTKAHLESVLRRDRMSEVFQLRAHTYVKTRIEEELALRKELSARMSTAKVTEGVGPDASPKWKICQRLRALESELLARAYEYFQATTEVLTSRPDVQDFVHGIPLKPKSAAHQWEDRPDDHNSATSSDEELEMAALVAMIKANHQQEEVWGNGYESSQDSGPPHNDTGGEQAPSWEQAYPEGELSDDSFLESSDFMSEEDWLLLASSVTLTKGGSDHEEAEEVVPLDTDKEEAEGRRDFD